VGRRSRDLRPQGHQRPLARHPHPRPTAIGTRRRPGASWARPAPAGSPPASDRPTRSVGERGMPRSRPRCRWSCRTAGILDPPAPVTLYPGGFCVGNLPSRSDH
jgi:hypothetical protein